MLDPLIEFLDGCGLGEGEPLIEPIGDGHSNVTYAITRGEPSFVLRRPPRGPLPPSAHDVLREARVLSALEGRARVPRVLATCADAAVIGAPFYVMERVEGHVITSEVPAELDSAERPRADLRRARRRARRDPRRRLARRPGSRASASRPATSSASCGASSASGRSTRRATSRPSSRSRAGSARTCRESGPATIVHGDYRLGNTMYAPDVAGAARRGIRLGDGDDRRPAGGPRLPLHAVGRPRRPAAAACSSSAASRASRASRRAPS